MSEQTTIRWEAPGPYEVAFSTRRGGVSEGDFASLNLGVRTEDEPERVLENRRRLCERAGLDPGRAALGRQEHGARVHRARAEGILDVSERRAGDGLWSDEADQAMLVLSADCVPLALARVGGERPALAVLHAGWRGLLAGIVANGAAALGGGRLA
nr:laccase domain-containing protein [Actinomycetota bacterium]